jgi:hypothetical protein
MTFRQVAISVSRERHAQLAALLRNPDTLARYQLEGLIVDDDDEPPRDAAPVSDDGWFRGFIKRVTAIWRHRRNQRAMLPVVSAEGASPALAPRAPSQVRDEPATQEGLSLMRSRARLKARDLQTALALRRSSVAVAIGAQELGSVIDRAWSAYLHARASSAAWPRRAKKLQRARLQYGLRQSCVGAQLVAASVAPGRWSALMYEVGVSALEEGDRMLGTGGFSNVPRVSRSIQDSAL